MSRRVTLRRRLVALEVGEEEGPPAYVVVTRVDVAVPEPGEAPPVLPDPASLVTVVRVSDVPHPILRRPGETDEALFDRAARAWPRFGVDGAVPVLRVSEEPRASLAH